MFDEVIVALLVLNMGFSLWMLRVLGLQLKQTVGQLDQMVDEKIQRIKGEVGFEGGEPPNAIQQAIGHWLHNTLSRSSTPSPTASIIDVDVVRDAAGKFS